MRCFRLLFVLLFGISFLSIAQEEILLWPDGAPGAMGNRPEDKPSIKVYLADQEKANGTAVLICPGGGYVTLADKHEGLDFANWFNELGITAFVLKYRLGTWDHKGYEHPAPWQDATRAIQIIKSRAKEWNINPDRVGIIGFSAGGHLASTVGTIFINADEESRDPVLHHSSRPAFMILCYPVIALNASYTHKFSRAVLLGPDPDLDLVDSLSTQNRVTSLTPPTFLFHTNEDSGVPPENSTAFYLALRENNIQAELHIYEKGKHGVGLAKDDPVLSTWSDRLFDWLKVRGLLQDIR